MVVHLEQYNLLSANSHVEPGQFLHTRHVEYLEQEEQEAHGPQVAHRSDIATGDMQMLCNIFPILSSQLSACKGSLEV